MRPFPRLIAALALALALVAPLARADAVDDVMHRYMALGHVPGAAVVVVRDGEIERVQGYGLANLEWSIPVAADTSFQLASATKLFTGVVLMRLVEQGKIELDEPVSHYLKDAPASWRKVSIRHLATHTSGIPDRLPSHPDTVEGVVAAAMKAPLEYEPGTRSRYGFTDFVVLRAVLERVSGKSLPALLQAEIIGPLALADTGFNHARNDNAVRSAAPLPRRASVHSWSDGEQRVSDFLYRETGYGAGGLFSSARDMAKVFVALDRGELLRPASLAELTTPARLADGSRGEFGVGWTARTYHGERVVGHSGGPALADVLRIESRRLTVIVLTNQQRLYPVLAEAVVDVYLPARPALRPIEDASPETTARMLSILAEARGGKVDEALFADSGRRATVPFLCDFGGVLLTMVGAPRRAHLLETRREAAGLVRRYAIDFENKQMVWLLRVDAEGLIEELRPASE